MLAWLGADVLKVERTTGGGRLWSWALRDEFAVGLLGFAGAPMDGSG
jgi:crotonobetainyl-CoA:carnitine CoA-transferase CaiB-like acyl-CoA transferase